MTVVAPFADPIDPAAPLPALRQAGLERWRAQGLPGPAVEAWKYTSLEKLAALGLGPAVPGALSALPAGVLAVEGWRAVFVDGRFAPALSALDGLPPGATIESLAAFVARDPVAAEAELALATDAGPLVALNTALFADGLVLRLARGTVLDRPLHLVSVSTGSGAAHPRHLVRLEPDAMATLVESHVGTGAGFSNHVADIRVARGATLRHYKLQAESTTAFHVAALRLEMAERASYEGFVLHAGAALARHELRAMLTGEGIDCRMGGLYLAAGDQHVDNTTVIDHAAPGSQSRQLFKGVLDDAARGVFQGRVLVRPDAQKTDAHQLSRALLLSRKAEMDGKPELEIYADDVRCSHGATIGSLDQEPMFYLRSRGIDADTAYRMLVEAFATEALDAISAPALRDAFAAPLQAWLAGRHIGGAK